MGGGWAAVLAALVGGSLAAGRSAARRRLRRTVAPAFAAAPAPDRPPAAAAPAGRALPADGRAVRRRSAAARWGAAGLAAVSVGGLVGGRAAPVVALVLLVGLPPALARLPDRDDLDRRAELARDLPLALDLLAATLSAGAPTPDAVRAVAAGVGGEAGARLARVAAELALGAEPGGAWAAAGDEPALQRLARAAVRVAASGAALAGVVADLADTLRDSERERLAAAGRRAGVWAVLPVGLCFLPAFVLVGVVPVLVGLLPSLLR